jgi:hypothetical protein
LHAETLSIIIQVLTSAGPQSLEHEPNDCIAAFMGFITKQIEDQQYVVDTAEKAQAIVCDNAECRDYSVLFI